jgi:hypothetical protein
MRPSWWRPPGRHNRSSISRRWRRRPRPAAAPRRTVGAEVDPGDPLAVLAHGKQAPARSAPKRERSPRGGADRRCARRSRARSRASRWQGDAVAAGRALVVLEAMKMEHVIEADRSGIVRALAAAPGETVAEGEPLVWLEEAEVARGAGDARRGRSRARPRRSRRGGRAPRARLRRRRPDAVARRRKTGQRTARENVADLCDPEQLHRVRPLAIAAQRRRRTLEDLTLRTPADGLIAGIGSVNGDAFGADARAAP